MVDTLHIILSLLFKRLCIEIYYRFCFYNGFIRNLLSPYLKAPLNFETTIKRLTAIALNRCSNFVSKLRGVIKVFYF